MHISEIYDKMKGLNDLLWAVVALVENGSSLRFEGALTLANMSSEIEHGLESLVGEGEKD